MSVPEQSGILQDRVAIVTGASRGSGRAIALALAQEGADILLAARSVAELQSVQAEIEALGRRALVVPTDMQNAAEVAALPDRAVAGFGRLDILVNNAGGAGAYIEGGTTGLLDTTLAAWDGIMGLNLRGPFIAAQAAAQIMARNGGGVILNVSSANGMFPRASYQAYSAAKSALNTLTTLWAVELGEYGVRVNAIAPGMIEAGKNGARLMNSPQARAEREAMIPAGRLGKPGDIAALAVFLASDAAAYISGAVVLASGGWRGDSETLKRRGALPALGTC
jgi:NAD(P)-dependent dehydrogenase (short-subunit alcohol dehydrogenase family)